jgi:hypothetical protein
LNDIAIESKAMNIEFLRDVDVVDLASFQDHFTPPSESNAKSKSQTRIGGDQIDKKSSVRTLNRQFLKISDFSLARATLIFVYFYRWRDVMFDGLS